MTSQVKMQVSTLNGNDESVKYTINWLNPQATDATLKSFAVLLNGLTTNTFVAVAKIVTLDITEAE